MTTDQLKIEVKKLKADLALLNDQHRLMFGRRARHLGQIETFRFKGRDTTMLVAEQKQIDTDFAQLESGRADVRSRLATAEADLLARLTKESQKKDAFTWKEKSELELQVAKAKKNADAAFAESQAAWKFYQDYQGLGERKATGLQNGGAAGVYSNECTRRRGLCSESDEKVQRTRNELEELQRQLNQIDKSLKEQIEKMAVPA